MGRRPARFPTWLRTIPERLAKASFGPPPDERISRRARRRDLGDTPRPENELDGADGARVEHTHARAAPAREGTGASVADGNTAGGDGQSRTARLYPLGRGPRGARLAA